MLDTLLGVLLTLQQLCEFVVNAACKSSCILLWCSETPSCERLLDTRKSSWNFVWRSKDSTCKRRTRVSYCDAMSARNSLEDT